MLGMERQQPANVARIAEQAQRLELRRTHLEWGRRIGERSHWHWENWIPVDPSDPLPPARPWDDEQNGGDEVLIDGMPQENNLVPAALEGRPGEILAEAPMEDRRGGHDQRAVAGETNEDTLESHDSSELDDHEQRGSEDSQISYHSVASANKVSDCLE
jgi:hypothetical protein